MKSILSKCFLLFFFSFLFVITIKAQNNMSVTLRILDAQTGQPIAYANAVLTSNKTLTVFNGAQSDTNGNVIISRIPPGIFKMEISFSGYQTITRDSIRIDTNGITTNLGNLSLSRSASGILKEVIITAPKTNSEIGISKKVFSVAQNLVSVGGTATDLLQNIPTVSIDVNGLVNLRGSSSVQVFIDGKPSLIGGGDIVQILASIPANAIQSIEVITNPSVKYDAEGGAGIINIILKKNRRLGFSGSMNGTAGTKNNYSWGSALSFENSRINVFANYNYLHSSIYSNGHQNITYTKPSDSIVYSNETFPSTTENKSHNGKGGIEYYLNPKNLLSFSGGFNIFRSNRNENLDIEQLGADQSPLQRIESRNIIDGNGYAYNLNLDYIRTFRKPKEELDFSIGYSQGVIKSNLRFTSDINNLNDPSDFYDTTVILPEINNHNRYYNIQTDYSLPLGNANFAAGYRSQMRIDNRDQLVYNYDQSSGNYSEFYPYSAYFHGNSQIHALYISYQNQIHNFSYQFGLRGEAANLKGYVNGYDSAGFPQTTLVSVVNNRIYPTVTLSQKFNGGQQLQFNYTRRVARPTPRNYSPIPDISDPVNYDVGNPNILPQDIHNFEFSYSLNGRKMNFTTSLYYRITNDFIAHIETTPVNGVITTISENLPHAYVGGLELINSVNVFKSWNFAVNANLYQTRLDGDAEYGISNSSGFSWNINVTNNFLLFKNTSLQVRCDYLAPSVTAQDRDRASFATDAAAKINLFHNKAWLTVNGRDIFNTRRWAFLRDGNGVSLDFERRTIGARASISFTYNFGQDIFHAKKLEHSSEKQEN
jgi:ferric enterobactin receptor